MNFVAALLCGASAAVLCALALAFPCGGLGPGVAKVALASGTIVAGFFIWKARTESSPRRRLHVAEWAAIGFFGLFSLRAFLWLVFVDDDAIKVLSPNNLGDLSLHLTYIRYLANGAPFWPENPIFAGGALSYPIGMDLLNSLLSLIGVNDLRGLIWVGLAGCVCTGLALWRWGGAFTLAGFLGNGGLAGFAIFHTAKLSDFQSELAWKSLPLALFVTQRGLLFALPAGLLLLCSWRARFFAPHPGAWRLPVWSELLLYAAMPVFHFHTFLFLSAVLAIWFCVKAETRGEVARFLGLAFLPATALVLLVTNSFRGASMLGWKPGWMQDEQNFFTFWLSNFGVLPLFVGALVYALRKKPGALGQKALAGIALGIFLLCCYVKFAPWEWDNTKLMIWSYLVLLPLLWSEVIARFPVWLRAVSCGALFFSGSVSLLGGLDASHTGYAIASRAELDGVAAATRGMPVTERFVGWPNYNHPLLLLGRKMALGYTGHAWSHGLDWQATAEKVNAVLQGAPEWRARCAELGVRYLFWGKQEDENVPSSAQPWRETARLVARGEWGSIYDLAAPAAPAEERDLTPR